MNSHEILIEYMKRVPFCKQIYEQVYILIFQNIWIGYLQNIWTGRVMKIPTAGLYHIEG